MIPKVIFSDSYAFNDLTVRLVPLHSRGVDSEYLRKHANHGLFNNFIQTLTPTKDRSVIHVLAVGDEEFYGPNRNCDGFSRDDNVTAHRSFKDIGHVFHNHMNDDPEKSVGDVLATGHNDVMSRIELILSLDNNKCWKEVSALDSGGDVPVSMGSMQDYDVCSVCGHKAPTADKHCNHIKNMLGSVLGDGRKVYMQNPRPRYFDISLVFKPADRIAYTLRKVANENGQMLGGHELAEMLGIRSWSDPKTATVRCLARMYKEVPSHLRKVTSPERLQTTTVNELKKKANIHGLDHLLAFLNANGWLLAPEDFGSVIGHQDPCACRAAVESHNGLDQLLEDHTEVQSLQEPTSVDHIDLSDFARADLQDAASMLPEGTGRRAIKVTIIKPVEKLAVNMDRAESWGLSALYNNYKLAFAHKHHDRLPVLRGVAASF